MSCTGLPASTSFLLVEASLLVAIDPSAKPLLTGTSVTTLPGLLALISATPELNATSVAFPNSNASGDLTYGYTVPSIAADGSQRHLSPLDRAAQLRADRVCGGDDQTSRRSSR